MRSKPVFPSVFFILHYFEDTGKKKLQEGLGNLGNGGQTPVLLVLLPVDNLVNSGKSTGKPGKQQKSKKETGVCPPFPPVSRFRFFAGFAFSKKVC